MDVPLELANALYLKTLEKRIAFALEKRSELTLNNTLKDNKTGSFVDPVFDLFADKLKLSKVFGLTGYNLFLRKQPSLQEINKENEKLLIRLKELFTFIGPDHPVAFASSSFYAMEFNQKRDLKSYEKYFYPLFRQKAEFLSLEGIAGSLLAFSKLSEPDA